MLDSLTQGRSAGELLRSVITWLTDVPSTDDPVGIGLRIIAVLAAFLVVGLLLTALVRMVRALYRFIQRRRAQSDLRVRISSGFRATRLLSHREPGSFLLGFPRWRHANADGTRDRRRTENRLIRRGSVVEVGRWRITSYDPLALYSLVVELRRVGHDIAPDEIERGVWERVSGRLSDQRSALDIDSLIAQFETRPTDFETFCAELFQSLGYEAHPTVRTGDGGIDIRLEKDGVRTIVECKCYRRSHAVGRPVIQKLYGANATEGAEHMLVVTTSSFSREAVAYAAQTGVALIDGPQLIAMCRRVWGNEMPPALAPSATVTLTLEDLRPHYPADAQPV